ncbi:hypothetical protein Misp05_37010 [Micromonospora sp. NBRC 107095]|nr:hypothetical protein Misp05_37010 [Micromonospora sp. NBRC 107095]
MRHSPERFGGFYLSTPKSGPTGTFDLDAMVAEELGCGRRIPRAAWSATSCGKQAASGGNSPQAKIGRGGTPARVSGYRESATG